MEMAGLPCGQGSGHTPHVLRSVGISLLDRSGISEPTIRAISGHDDDQVYRRYNRAFQHELETAVVVLGRSLITG